MQRFFISPACFQENLVLLDEQTSRQISQVLRMSVDRDQIIVLDNSGTEYFVQLMGWQGRQLRAEIRSQQAGRPEASPAIWLCFSLTKRDKVEWIFQKGTEIGVSVFQPFVSERSLSRELSPDPGRQARWQAIAREAAEQCRRSKLPVIQNPLPFEKVVKQDFPAAVRLIAWEDTNPAHRIDPESLGVDRLQKVESIHLAVGPEGGFSSAEVTEALENGYKSVSLGATTLRMETACMVGPAIIRHVLESAVTAKSPGPDVSVRE